MSKHLVPQVGAVFSADIAVPEHEREMRFYSRVLSTGDHPLWRDDLLNNAGLPIIGLGALRTEYANLPLQWMPHIQVADVAASVQRALELGGRELMHAKSDGGGSQWAVLLDPNGAAFGIIPVVPAEQLPPVFAESPSDASSSDVADEASEPETSMGEPSIGRIAWLDLTVPDAAAARDFYRHVIGWSVEDVEMQDEDVSYADYHMMGADGTPLAGICHARGVNAVLPPVWMIYLPVGDLAESVRRAEAEGGQVLKAVGNNGKYAYAAIRDPVGAHFALVQA